MKEETKCCENYNGALDITNSCIFCKTYKPKTPQDVINQAREDTLKNGWSESIDEAIRENLIWYKENGNDHGDLVIAEEAIKAKFINWHTSTLQAFIEAEIAREEGMKYPSKEGGSKDMPYTEMTIVNDGKPEEALTQWIYNQAKEETINHFKELLVTLKR